MTTPATQQAGQSIGRGGTGEKSGVFGGRGGRRHGRDGWEVPILLGRTNAGGAMEEGGTSYKEKAMGCPDGPRRNRGRNT